MRICLHTYYEIANPYIGGTQTLLIKLAKELKLIGHEVFIVCSNLCPHYTIEEIDIYGIIPKKYIDLLRNEFDGIPSSKFLKKAISSDEDIRSALMNLARYAIDQVSQFKADVYHLNSYAASLYADELQAPVVAYQHENKEEFDGLWGRGSFDELIKQIKTAHGKTVLFAASHHYAEQFSKLLETNVKAVHLGISLNDMPFSNKVKFSEKTCFGRNDNSIVILVPSRFNVKQKGQDLAIMACEKLLEKYDIEIVFSGTKNSLKTELELFREKYRNLRIANRLHFIAVNNMHDLYESAHIVLSPERFCSYGLSISEALAMGVPTVLSNIPTYVEIASGYRHAYFFQNDNLNDLILVLSDVMSKVFQNNLRDNEAAIDFRMNNDIRNTAMVFSRIYKQLL